METPYAEGDRSGADTPTKKSRNSPRQHHRNTTNPGKDEEEAQRLGDLRGVPSNKLPGKVNKQDCNRESEKAQFLIRCQFLRPLGWIDGNPRPATITLRAEIR
jgi:hypothetical protein